MSSAQETQEAKSREQKLYIVEHLDPELEAWSALEYRTIAEECHATGSCFLLCSVPETLEVPKALLETEGLQISHQGVEILYSNRKQTVCLLDPSAAKELTPSDGDKFSVFLFGGILGDNPPRDRTSELRSKGFEGRRLGPVQMTTDTAVRVTRMVAQERKPLDKIDYVDFPELRVNEHESVQMPFRYVKGTNGDPIMPEGIIELIKQDAEKGFGELM